MSSIVRNGTSRLHVLLIAIGTLLVGLAVGYWLFADVGSEPGEAEQMHDDDHNDSGVYTCSMHPQIRSNQPGDCPICGMELIPASSETDDELVLAMTETAVALAELNTTAVREVSSLSELAASEEGDASASGLRVSGRLQTDETRAATQSAHVAGRIERLLVGFEGERVQVGQRIAEVYAPELVSAQRELLEAARLAGSSPEVGEALLTAARTRLSSLEIPATTIDEILQTGQTRERFPILADAAGVVLDKRVEVGDYVREGETLYTLSDLSTLYAEFDVFEEALSRISLGSRVEFSTPAAPGRTFTGRITFVDPLIDPTTRTATVRAEVSNASGLLKPEMLIRGEITASTRGSAFAKTGNNPVLAIPATAVLWTGERSVVYVAVPDASVPSYRFREVTLGERVGDFYAVTDGLSASEQVVSRGAFAVDASAQLENQPSMMNRGVRRLGEAAPGGETAVVVPDFTTSTPAPFQQQLLRSVEVYLSLKDALVAGDDSVALEAALGFGESLEQIDMQLLSQADAHELWMEQLEALAAHSTDIAEAETLEEARRQFAFLSTALIAGVEAFGLPPASPEGMKKPTDVAGLYVQHCPMALDNAGAN